MKARIRLAIEEARLQNPARRKRGYYYYRRNRGVTPIAIQPVSELHVLKAELQKDMEAVEWVERFVLGGWQMRTAAVRSEIEAAEARWGKKT